MTSLQGIDQLADDIAAAGVSGLWVAPNGITLLKSFMDSNRNGRTALLIGDLNIRSRERYENFVRTIRGLNAGQVCDANRKICTVGKNTTPDDLWRQTNDHQFIILGKRIKLSLIFMIRNYGQKVKGKRLSDHRAFEAIY